MKNCVIVCDLQFGSTGKGQVCGGIVETPELFGFNGISFDSVASANGPNSGHTYKSKKYKIIGKALPVAARLKKIKKCFIGGGSVINPSNFLIEADEVFTNNPECYIIVHPHAAVVSRTDIDIESNKLLKISSTQQGTGAASCRKIMREETAVVSGSLIMQNIFKILSAKGVRLILPDKAADYTAELLGVENLLIEGSQGFSLGLESGLYPYVTSRECVPARLCSDVGVPFQVITDVVGVIRTLPIRVGNRYNVVGDVIGFSGPIYADQRELSWDAVGVKPEITTVTNIPRRIFSFSCDQFFHAVSVCRPNRIHISFCDYLTKDGVDNLKNLILTTYDKANLEIPFISGSFGPSSNHVEILHKGCC